MRSKGNGGAYGVAGAGDDLAIPLEADSDMSKIAISELSHLGASSMIDILLARLVLLQPFMCAPQGTDHCQQQGVRSMCSPTYVCVGNDSTQSRPLVAQASRISLTKKCQSV